MARIGFKKIYPAGSFDKAAVQTLFSTLRVTLASAGFNVLLDAADAIDVIRMGATAGSADDDTPHWAFSFVDWGDQGGIQAWSVFGNTYNDPAALTQSDFMASSGWISPIQDLTVWFAADGLAGWWWIHGSVTEPESQTGVEMRFAYAGATSRRYPSDTYPGLCARYGIWDTWGDWYPPYARNEEGSPQSGIWIGTWSPLGEGWSNNGKRHPGSPLPKMAVPQFPSRDEGVTACILGEFNEILALTDGFAMEEAPVPGWIAFVGNEWDQPYAVPAPDNFDSEPG